MTTLATRLDEVIRENMERSRVAGLAIALVKDGELVAAEGYGLANVETGALVEAATRFSAMSVTKTIVSTAVMQLRDRGLLDLDAPVNEYLAPARITNEWEAEDPVTMRRLLTHTGGLPVGTGPMFGKTPLAQFVTNNARTTYRPGTDMLYANWGFDAAGVVIENLSGKPVDAYLREAIFGPLGMTASALANPEDGAERAHGHYASALDEVLRVLPLPDWPTIPVSPAGGVWSNVLDLSKFLIAHLTGGGGLLDSASVAEMHRLHARQGSSESGQGIGFRVTDINGRRAICHGGDGGGFTAYLAAHPEDGVGVVLLINTGGMQVARSVIGNTALEALAAKTSRTGRRTVALASGEYKSTFWDITVEARGDDTVVATEGLVLAPEANVSHLSDGEGQGGMFHGFDVAAEGDRFYGGVYPFTFVRSGDIPVPDPIDEAVDLIGSWTGVTQTPMGAMATTLRINSPDSATADTPFAQGLDVGSFSAESGRVEGDFVIQVPGVGENHLFLRLEACGGKLTGKTYARSSFGEIPMATDLERA